MLEVDKNRKNAWLNANVFLSGTVHLGAPLAAVCDHINFIKPRYYCDCNWMVGHLMKAIFHVNGQTSAICSFFSTSKCVTEGLPVICQIKVFEQHVYGCK